MSQANVNDFPPNPANATNQAAGLPEPRDRTLRKQSSMLLLQSVPTTLRTTNVGQRDDSQNHIIPTPEVPIEEVERCKDLWFEDGDVIIWAQDQNHSLLYRVHRRVLGESGAEPFCTIVDWDYPNPETSDETFLDGIWVLKYADQDPIDIMYMLKWMYDRP